MIDQQMWCWGYDVRRRGGNLLLAYGAEKRPSPNPKYHSCYTSTLDNGAVINVWGWGLWTASTDYGSLFISRSRFRVRYTPDVIYHPQSWRQRELPHAYKPRQPIEHTQTQQLLGMALRWIGDYETWLNQHMGQSYREQVITAWLQLKKHKRSVHAQDMATHWYELADQINALATSDHTQ